MFISILQQSFIRPTIGYILRVVFPEFILLARPSLFFSGTWSLYTNNIAESCRRLWAQCWSLPDCNMCSVLVASLRLSAVCHAQNLSPWITPAAWRLLRLPDHFRFRHVTLSAGTLFAIYFIQIKRVIGLKVRKTVQSEMNAEERRVVNYLIHFNIKRRPDQFLAYER